MKILFVCSGNICRSPMAEAYMRRCVARTGLAHVDVDSAGTLGSGVRRPFERIRTSRLRPNDTFVLLFLVDPGAHIVSFSTGGDATRQDDLTGQNLTAPQ